MKSSLLNLVECLLNNRFFTSKIQLHSNPILEMIFITEPLIRLILYVAVLRKVEYQNVKVVSTAHTQLSVQCEHIRTIIIIIIIIIVMPLD